MKKYSIPKHLTAGTKRWIEYIEKTWTIDEHLHDVVVLAGETRDQILKDTKRVQTEGEYYTDRWGCPKPHPALAEIRNNKVVFARLLRELNLSDAPETPRPPGLKYR